MRLLLLLLYGAPRGSPGRWSYAFGCIDGVSEKQTSDDARQTESPGGNALRAFFVAASNDRTDERNADGERDGQGDKRQRASRCEGFRVTEIAPALIGFVVGLLVGATSTGGGALLTPALILIARVPAPIAIGSDVLIASVMKLFGGGFYALRHEVHWPTVGRLALGSIPGAVVGLAILGALPVAQIDYWLTRALGVVLVLAGGALWLRVHFTGKLRSATQPATRVTVAIGFVVGVLVATTSVGSGSLLLCALVLAYPLGARTTVGTDLVHALFLSAAATVGHAAAGRVDLALAGLVLAGAIPGVLLGARMSVAVPERVLRAGLATVLLLLGIHLATFGGTNDLWLAYGGIW
ncbi:MAG: sulfite exporter TauE/SafE family protein [Acidobacteria bacterium]|nr:sulfite exporter TauE/SafE family protein [Acidobacteriota bacterium]